MITLDVHIDMADTVTHELNQEDLENLNGLAGVTLMKSLSDVRLTKAARDFLHFAKAENAQAGLIKSAREILGDDNG